LTGSGRILVFAPHPDDETWGCGGVIAKRISQGFEVIVVVMTDGRYAFSEVLGIESDPTPEELTLIRRKEVMSATGILGVPSDNVLFLDFVDGKLNEFEKEAEEKVAGILKKSAPVEVYFPYRKDCHPDHRATNQIVNSCLLKVGSTSPRYQYSIERTHSRLGPIIDKIQNLFRRNMINVDVSDFLHLKDKAAKEFKSEISVISSKQERPLTNKISKYLKKTETFYVER